MPSVNKPAQTFRLRQNLQVFPPSEAGQKVKIIDPINQQTYFMGPQEIQLLRLIAKMPVSEAAKALKIEEKKIAAFIEYLQKNNLLDNPPFKLAVQKPLAKVAPKPPAIELRPDLNFIENENSLLIEDPITNRFFSLGLPEADLMFELMAKTAVEIKDYSPEQIESFIQSLSQKGILLRPAPVQSEPKAKNILSLFVQRFKLGNPDQMLGFLDENFGWLWKNPLFILHLGIIIFGFYMI